MPCSDDCMTGMIALARTPKRGPPLGSDLALKPASSEICPKGPLWEVSSPLASVEARSARRDPSGEVSSPLASVEARAPKGPPRGGGARAGAGWGRERAGGTPVGEG